MNKVEIGNTKKAAMEARSISIRDLSLPVFKEVIQPVIVQLRRVSSDPNTAVSTVLKRLGRQDQDEIQMLLAAAGEIHHMQEQDDKRLLAMKQAGAEEKYPAKRGRRETNLA